MFMPHMPFWHMPPPHPEIGSPPLFPEVERGAKVEYCVVKWSCPQDGQRTASASALRRTSFSNREPQSSQAYSKIGILLLENAQNRHAVKRAVQRVNESFILWRLL